MSKQLIEAILALKKRVDTLETDNTELKERDQINTETFIHSMTILVERLEAVEAKVDELKAPVIVDNDGVVNETADTLGSEFDSLKADVTEQVKQLKGWFHQHLNDHEINGGRTKMLSGAELAKFLNGDQP